jgi:hypothetical protein
MPQAHYCAPSKYPSSLIKAKKMIQGLERRKGLAKQQILKNLQEEVEKHEELKSKIFQSRIS